MRTDRYAPPLAPREPHDVSVHGDPRIDDYFWLRDRDDPRTLPYLRAENAYAEAWFAPHAALKEALYQEMLGRIQQDDDSVPMRKGAWWYSTQTRQGEQYPRYLRRRALGGERRFDPDAAEETLLDLNEMARGKPFLRLGLSAVSRDATRLAYTVDFTGGRDFTLHVKDARRRRDRRLVGRAGRLGGVGQRQPHALLRDDGRDQAREPALAPRRRRRARRRAAVRGGRRAVRHRRRQEPRRALSLHRQRKQGLDRVARRRRRCERRCAVRAAHGLRAPRRHRVLRSSIAPGASYVRINDTGRNFRLVTVDATARPTSPAPTS